MHVQRDLSLTVIALIVIYLIGHFVISANSMQVAFIVYLSLGNVNDLQATN